MTDASFFDRAERARRPAAIFLRRNRVRTRRPCRRRYGFEPKGCWFL
jgi:hypothetical protein